MSDSRIQLRPAARQALLALDKPTRRRLQRAIDGLSDGAPPNAVTLNGLPGAHRFEAAAHQVVYLTQNGEIVILLIEPTERR
jgi:mRNA-degrading endonuclease RelE of RelBE toxin-antitoxin system